MDDKAKSEARRKKILDNAEARLRFIKEGIPWRNDDIQNDSSFEFIKSEELEQETPALPSQYINHRLESGVDHENLESQSSLTESENKPHISSNILETDFKNTTNTKIIDNTLEKDNIQTNSTTSSNKLQTEKPSNFNKNSDPFKTLQSLLNESSRERLVQKQKGSEHYKNVWINCFIMIFMGIFVRISYDMGISWIFSEMMLVPFITVALPRLISLIINPPPPSGTFLQVLIMSGVKVPIINKVFAVLFILRSFLQLFSVYLISFIFTHQIVNSSA